MTTSSDLLNWKFYRYHYCDVIMSRIVSQITSFAIVYSTVYSGANQRKHQSSMSLAFVQGIHRWPVNSPHKWPVTGKMFPFDVIIMSWSDKIHPTYTLVNLTSQSTGSSLIKVMDCSLFSFKPFPELLLTCCQLNPWEDTVVKLKSKYKRFLPENCTRKCQLQNGVHVVQVSLC